MCFVGICNEHPPLNLRVILSTPSTLAHTPLPPEMVARGFGFRTPQRRVLSMRSHLWTQHHPESIQGHPTNVENASFVSSWWLNHHQPIWKNMRQWLTVSRLKKMEGIRRMRVPSKFYHSVFQDPGNPAFLTYQRGDKVTPEPHLFYGRVLSAIFVHWWCI